jgi:hypothetical protein
MRLYTSRGLVALLALGAFVGFAQSARADRNDLTLERLLGPPKTPGAFNDPDLATQTEYRSLMSELGVVMAPTLLSPADSLGWSGFQFDLASSFTQISNQSDYWKKGVADVSSSWLSTVSVLARKGIWAPLPSFEIGAGGTALTDSGIFALQAYAKLALHEGYHGWAMPSMALRAAVSRLVGTTQVDMTVISTDATLSKSFGLGGTMRLDPYLGANLLVTIVRSQVIDTTPNIDAYKQYPSTVDLNSNTTFPDAAGDNILRWRMFAGFRLVYSVVSLSAEFSYAFCNDTANSCGKNDLTKLMDRSNGQVQLSLAGGLIF